MWEVEELPQLLSRTPFIAITVMFLVIQVRFCSLVCNCIKKIRKKKSLKRWNRRKELTARSAGFEE
jgi:hypothetical protein